MLDVIHCPGHTPGHTGFLIGPGNERLLIWGDVDPISPLAVAIRASLMPPARLPSSSA